MTMKERKSRDLIKKCVPLILTMLFVSSCTTNNSQASPENTVRRALDSISEGKTDRAEKYFTPQYINDGGTYPYNGLLNNCLGIDTGSLDLKVSYMSEDSVNISVYYGTQKIMPVSLNKYGDEWLISHVYWEDCKQIR